jgi:hypothetical protein
MAAAAMMLSAALSALKLKGMRNLLADNRPAPGQRPGKSL